MDKEIKAAFGINSSAKYRTNAPAVIKSNGDYVRLASDNSSVESARLTVGSDKTVSFYRGSSKGLNK